MRIGPFGVFDTDQIVETLTAKAITFEVFVDEQEKERILNKYHETVRRDGGVQLDLKIVYFDIADDDFPRVATILEKYGVVLTQSDGSYELGDETGEEQ